MHNNLNFNNHIQFNKNHNHDIENSYNPHSQIQTNQLYINDDPNQYISYNNQFNKLNFNSDLAEPNNSSQFPQMQEQKTVNGRTLSPAIPAKSIQVNRNIPFPAAQNRPPHLRINNDSWGPLTPLPSHILISTVTMNSSVKRDLLIYVTILKKCLHHIEWIKTNTLKTIVLGGRKWPRTKVVFNLQNVVFFLFYFFISVWKNALCPCDKTTHFTG